jgi:hypothetical protein
MRPFAATIRTAGFELSPPWVSLRGDPGTRHSALLGADSSALLSVIKALLPATLKQTLSISGFGT